MDESRKSHCGGRQEYGLPLSWLYDEDRWPSGFAEGKVPSLGEKYRLKYLECLELEQVNNEDELFKVFLAERKNHALINIEDVTDEIKNKKSSSASKNKNATLLYTRTAKMGEEWHNGYTYVDLMDSDVVKEFIKCTHDEYKKVVGKDFGKAVPANFHR